MKTQVLACFLGVMLAAAGVRAAEPIGQIVALQGRATALGADGQSRDLALKGPVFLNDRVKTETGARLQIMFSDDSMISQGEKSEMTIDEYVYSPGKKEDNAFGAGMSRGVFRLVTDKIMKLNPDRFKVKTQMATIGLRGCDIGFNLSAAQEDILILALHGDELVTILHQEGQHGPDQANYHNAGLTVILQPGQNIQSETLTTDILMGFLQSLNISSHAEAGAGTGGTGGGGDVLQPSEPAPLPELPQAPELPLPQLTPPQPPPPPPPPAASTPAPQPVTQEAAPEPAAAAQPPAPVATGAGTEWSWGIWAPDTSLFATSHAVNEADFQALITGSTLYTLAGVGTAGALVTHGGGQTLVQGTCDLSMHLGRGSLNNWGGDFYMTHGDIAYPDAKLRFSVAGNFDAHGLLTGNQAGYSLVLPDGSSYDSTSLTADQVNGQLVGPGSGATPITGAGGTFRFTHGTAADVNGAFGADLH